MKRAPWICAVLLAVAGPAAGGTSNVVSSILIDCARPGPADLVKKFDVGQTGYSRPEQWAVAKGRVRPLGAKQVRIIGGLMQATFGGTPLSEQILGLLEGEGAAPYVSLGPFGGPEQDPANLVTPAPLDRWRRLVREAAIQSRKHGGVWFEVWNEPNYPNFWRGSMQELFELHRIMVKEVAAVHPQAKFASPGITSGGIGKWVGPFLDFVETNALPLHAISFHDFGRDYTLGSRWILPSVKSCLSELGRRPYFRNKNVEIHVGECSFFPDPKDGEEADRAKAAAQLPQTIHELLSEPRLTLVQWAQMFDTGHAGMWGNLGVIDAETRRAKPLYNVFVMYALMPVQSAWHEEQGLVQCLAGQDKETVAVMLYNRTDRDAPCHLAVRNLPFAAGTKLHACTFAVDRRHSSFWDTPGDGRLEVVARSTVLVPANAAEPGPAIAINDTVPGPGVKLILLSARAKRFDPTVVAERPVSGD